MKLLSALASVVALAAIAPAGAQDFPERTITMVVGASPGGSTDVSARFLAEPLSKALGKAVVVENKPGASGNIGAAQVARAKPDGHTLLMQYSGYHVGNPHLFDKLNWELKDFAPVALVTFSPHLFAVHPDVKANNLKELADLAKANPGTLKYGSAGNGSIQHMATELFAQMTGTKLVHLPYKGAAPAVTDLLGGRLDIVNTTPPPLVPHVKAGKLKALAYTSNKRHPQFPEIPTSAEAGLPGYEIASWFGVLAPAKTPPAVIEKLASEIKKIVESDDFRQKIEEQGGVAEYKNPTEFQALIDKEYEYWGKVIKTAGIKAEEQ
ncbi:MAG TPA: tripartite tricarboxylate transporter substrate binding protein [Microvirga sp.]|jgi:tripartite-type tricarboxylate transporter receptor subunit TctC|nr:tripartite tricarboxylate transporter substrate binding protein [Microvirga sp.]